MENIYEYTKKIAKELGVSFGNLDLSLAPTPAEGDSVGQILETMGLAMPGAPGSTAALSTPHSSTPHNCQLHIIPLMQCTA